MPDERPLTPADLDDVQRSLAFALRFQGRKRMHTADDAMARITADRLIEHLRLSGSPGTDRIARDRSILTD